MQALPAAGRAAGASARQQVLSGGRHIGQTVADLLAGSQALQGALEDLVASHGAHVAALRCLAEGSPPAEAEGPREEDAAGAVAALPAGEVSEVLEGAPDREASGALEDSPGEEGELHELPASAPARGRASPSAFLPRASCASSREVHLHELWASAPRSRAAVSGASRGEAERPTLAVHGAHRPSNVVLVGSALRDGHAFGRRCVVRPGSRANIALAVMSLTVIMYDVVSLPFILAFQLEDTHAVNVLDVCACSFWTADLFVNFLVGYTEKDRIEMRMSKIAQRYVRTWFLFDFLVVGFDWATKFITDVPGRVGFARAAKSPRFIRIFFRTLRLIRLVKLVMLLEDVVQCVVTDWLNNAITVAKMLFGLILFNHFVACGWYAVGTSGIKQSWLDALDEPNASLLYRYVICFHWSMTQYTPAPNNYHPTNEHERIYACIILLVGICFFSAFLGKITSLLTHMSTTAFTRAQDQRVLKQYLAMNMVTLEVSNRIQLFLKNRQTTGRIVPHDEVRQFRDLPKSLAMELKYQSHSHALGVHPLMWRLMNFDNDYARFVLCLSQSVAEVGLKWGDELLHVGAPAKTMIFAKHGEMEYVSDAREATLSVLGPAQPLKWACEMALWCRWTCLGQLHARGVCIVLALDAQAFHTLATGSAVVFRELGGYAEAYARALREAFLVEQEHGPWSTRGTSPVDDVWGQSSVIQRLTEEAYGVALPARTTVNVQQARSAGWRIKLMKNQ